MKKLTVFYDANCGVCASFRHWIGREPAFLAIEFLPYDSRQAAELCPGLLERGADKKIIVMADDGRLWQGAEAWVLCLWALPSVAGMVEATCPASSPADRGEGLRTDFEQSTHPLKIAPLEGGSGCCECGGADGGALGEWKM